MIVFAIDPGLGGAWAVIVDGKPAIVGDMPVSGEGSRARVAAGLLAHHMRNSAPELCVIELVSAMPGNGVSGMFKFGMAFGAAIAVANVLDVPVELVTPQTWKKHFRLVGKDKEASRQRAIDLAPKLASSLARKKDDGRAEALLIGIYGAATWDQRPVAAVKGEAA